MMKYGERLKTMAGVWRLHTHNKDKAIFRRRRVHIRGDGQGALLLLRSGRSFTRANLRYYLY